MENAYYLITLALISIAGILLITSCACTWFAINDPLAVAKRKAKRNRRSYGRTR